jgi:peptide deformylase
VPLYNRPVSDEQAIDADENEEEELHQRLLERREAALAYVVKFGDPVLKSRASPVHEFGPELRDEVDRMIHIMQDGMGVGLAATQLGMLRRVLVFQAGSDNEPSALVNPKIEWMSDELAIAEEGCLSLPRVTMDVERPLHARFTGRDVDGEPVVIEASGLEARVLQHEIDHLDGVLILDRTVRQQRKAALRALRSEESYHPPSDDEDDPGEELREPRTDA